MNNPKRTACPLLSHRRLIILAALVLLLALTTVALASCRSEGNATPQERQALLATVKDYWGRGRDYSLGFTSAVGELISADVQGEEAEVVVEIIIGYTEPTDGAGYKDATFRLRKDNGSWQVTYDGWANKEVD